MKRVLLAMAAVALLAGSAWATTPPIVIPGNPWQPTDYRNESYIVQTGQVSWASVTQIGDQSYSEINQSDTKDTATVTQNSSCCTSGHCHCGPSWMGMPIFTSDDYQNYSKINQHGSGFHDAYHHTGSEHTATVSQTGDGNWSNIDQSGKKDTATVTQNGGFNYSDIQQSGNGVNNATVNQVGDLNTSYITQEDGINTALVSQNGFGNYSNILQDCFGTVNLATVTQVGYNNFSDISQTGNGQHTATVTQTNNCYNSSVLYCKTPR